MKKFILVLFSFILSMTCYAQIKFEKGYYIDNRNQRIECLIRNQDWEQNPDSFSFKHAESESPQKASIGNVSEFGIQNEFKYVRATTDIDLSSDNIQQLSKARNPEYQREQVFLKVLVEGKATLLEYNNGKILFFLKTDTASVVPLVYKTYLSTGNNIAENTTFRQQLLTAMPCDMVISKQAGSLKYTRRDLTKFFISYNRCINPGTAESSVTQKEKHTEFHLWLRPRLAISSAVMRRITTVQTYEYIPLERVMRFSGGIEAEFILPFNKKTWAITIEPTYQSYYSSTLSEPFANNPPRPVKIDYNTVELPIGVRHYFFLGDNSKISLGAALQLSSSINSTWSYSTVENQKITASPSLNLGFELGYVVKNKFCMSYRYQSARTLIFGDAINLDGSFNTMAFVVGYSIL